MSPNRAHPIQTLNPATGDLVRTYPETTEADVESRLVAADRAYRHELRKPAGVVAARRAAVLVRAAEGLEQRADELAAMVTLEMGKTLASAKSEILKCAKCCRYYASHGREMLASESATLTSGSHAEVRYEPLGTVLAIMPWNFPFWQVFRCAAPILLSGNSFILKHASNVPLCALAIEEIWKKAFQGENQDGAAFSTLLVSSGQVDGLIRDPRIRGVTLTGSEGAGKKVAAAAGEVLKKTVLELGGSDPFIVFESADLEKAIATAAQSRLLANGQSCIAAKRFLVHEKHYARFVEGLREKFASLRTGDPTESSTELGPLATAKIREDLHALVVDARNQGAKVTLGGEIPPGPGFHYPATIVEKIPPGCRLRREEAFGPLASLYRFRTTEEALEITNDTPFGLGASIWTNDSADIEICSRQLESGQLFVNDLVSSDPAVPFGGIKASGYGRELGIYGVREWTIVRTLVQRETKAPGSHRVE